MNLVENKLDEILSDTKQTLSDTKEIAAHNIRSDLVTWLAAPRPSTNQKEGFEKRFADTCHWFLKLKGFTEWKSGKRPILWLHGKSGSGKSILCSTVIDALKKENSSPQNNQVIYFYFDVREPESKQSFEKMLRSLNQQLSAQDEKAHGLLKDFHSSHDDGNREPLIGEFCSLFKVMIQTSTRVHIIIDALDECIARDDVGSTKGLLSWIQDIATNCPNAGLMVTSQLLDEIPSTLRKWVHEENEISIQSGSAADMETYIQNRVKDGNEFERWKESQHAHILDDIVERLTEEAHGM